MGLKGTTWLCHFAKHSFASRCISPELQQLPVCACKFLGPPCRGRYRVPCCNPLPGRGWAVVFQLGMCVMSDRAFVRVPPGRPVFLLDRCWGGWRPGMCLKHLVARLYRNVASSASDRRKCVVSRSTTPKGTSLGAQQKSQPSATSCHSFCFLCGLNVINAGISFLCCTMTLGLRLLSHSCCLLINTGHTTMS